MISQSARFSGRQSAVAVAACIALALAWMLSVPAVAEPVTPQAAKSMVTNWLSMDSRPLGARLGTQVDRVESYRDAGADPAYFVVYLRPNGFVIVSGDDLVEPVIAFVPEGEFDPSPNNPLGALVGADLPSRVGAVRSRRTFSTPDGPPITPTGPQAQARAKWTRLLGRAALESRSLSGVAGLSDPRVDPLIQSRWGQTTECGAACYNYYTPLGPEGASTNYPAGCLATAMAQLMRFYRYPGFGIGTAGYDISVYGVPRHETLRGGNGSGGPYDWDSMVLDPDCSTTLTQRQAIAALCHDAGCSINMDYRSEADGGSGATLTSAYSSILNTFYYSNARVYGSLSTIAVDKLYRMVNPNLHAGAPVILGIRRSGGNHAVVCDGYGYDASTQYHHLNMGWTGQDDAWYNLPNVDAVIHQYDAVTGCLYNVYTDGSGEIISGRVTDTAGSPVAGALVTAGSYSDVTDSRGIYALAKVPSSTAFTVQVGKDGFVFADRAVTTGYSQNGNSNAGNLWGIDFTGYAAFTIGDVKKKADDNTVGIRDVVVTAVFGDWFYVESQDRMMGILVNKPGHGLSPNLKVNLIGSLHTNDDYERYISAPTADDRGYCALKPVGISNPALGGANWKGYGGYTGRQKGVTGGSGLNNVGLLVRLVGRPTYIDSHNFTLDDGSGVGVHCVTPSDVTVNPLWQFVAVTGISSLERVGSELHRKFLIRSGDGVQVILP